MNDQQRAEFEAAARADGLSVRLRDGLYTDHDTRWFHAGWLAARRDTVPRKDVEEVLQAHRIAKGDIGKLPRLFSAIEALAAKLKSSLDTPPNP